MTDVSSLPLAPFPAYAKDSPSLDSPSVDSPAKNRLRVAKIQRTCVHDGPGLRTTLFFQGCGLRCLWCQNPEMIAPSAPSTPSEEGSCEGLSELFEVVLRDKAYYDSTGGGVTLSGGEPLLQDPVSLRALLQRFQDEGLQVAVETSLHAPWKHIALLLPYISLFLVDLKVVGHESQHRELTGQSDRLIRSNLQKLLQVGAPLRFRMVLVPGYNDKAEHIEGAAALLRSISCKRIELLKYHNMYQEKARRLGLVREDLPISNERALSAVKKATQRFAAQGLQATCQELQPPRAKASFPKRVYQIQEAIRQSPHSLCFEVSRLKTDYYKKEGFTKSAYIHRAERLAYVLERKKIIVYPGELLVGNFTSKRRGAQVWEEHWGTLLGSIVHQIDRQKPIPFQCSREDKLQFYTRIMPFWLKRSLLARALPTFQDFMKLFARCSEMNTGFNNNLASIAHFIVHYERLLQLGTSGIIEEAEAKKRESSGKDKAFYEGVIIALRGLEFFAQRYAAHLSSLSNYERDPQRRQELEKIAAICRHVPQYPARTYHEALQAMLFLHIALCLESFENAVSLGRLDQILYPYYLRDKEAGKITYEEAKELLALFLVKMDEVFLLNDGDTYLKIGSLFETMSTDQTVTAGGLDQQGQDATNDLTYALLDICELQPYAVNMTARIHPNSPPEYLERIAEVYINGAPMPALYNDEIYVETLEKHYDTTPEDARNYAIVGCVEPNASDDHYGNTDCANMNVVLPFLQALRGEEDDLWNFDLLDLLEKCATKFVDYHFSKESRLPRWVSSSYHKARALYKKARSSPGSPPANMDELLSRFQQRLNALATSILKDHQQIERAIREDFPTPLASSLSQGSMERARDVNEGGATFNSSGIQAVGITDVADSLHALDQLVFKQKRFSLDEVLGAMAHNFTGEPYEKIREALLAVPKFGHDGSPEAVEWVNRTLQIYVNALQQVPHCPRDGIYTAGYYALNVNGTYGKNTPALPSGRLNGAPLANSITPHYGMKVADLLSSLNSVAQVNFAEYAPNGTTVTFTIDSALFQGTEGIKNLAALFSTFFKKGGMQFQPNVINREILLDAYQHPEKYPHLLVRVAGYCAYFHHLSDDLKKIIINRTCYS